MAYEDPFVTAGERSYSIETLVMVAAYTLITGIALSSFLVALYFSAVHARWWLVAGTLGGTVVVFLLYYRGLETIFSGYAGR